MSRFIATVVVLLATLFLATPAFANGPVDKGSRHPNGGTDPCEESGDCGPGDYGKGDPTNGSQHANENAWRGEVDPVSQDEPVDDQEPVDDSGEEPSSEGEEPNSEGEEPEEPGTDPVVDPVEPGDTPDVPTQDNTPDSTPDSDSAPVVQSDDATDCGIPAEDECDVCEELAKIQQQNEQILANQALILEQQETGFAKILALLGELLAKLIGR